MNRSRSTRTATIVFLGLMIALSVVLVALIHFPIFPAVGFLEYDPADIPILITGLAIHPICGLITAFAAALIQGITVSAQSGVYGILMHCIATFTFVLTSSLLYRIRKNRGWLAFSLACGALAMTAIMLPANLLITPLFLGQPVGLIWQLMPLILLFNLVKAGINATFTYCLFAPLHGFLAKRVGF